MEKLIELGLNEEEINDMLESNPYLLDEIELNILIDILSLIHCDKRVIKNIITSNPEYLSRNKEDIVSLLNKFIELGFHNLNLLFDANPYLLNLDPFDLEDFKEENNYSNEELVNAIENNPFIIDEL